VVWACPLIWLTNHCPSVLWHSWLGHVTCKIVPEVKYGWFAAQRYYVHKTCFWEKYTKVQRLYVSLCGHTTFVLLTPTRTMTISEIIGIFSNNVNKISISIKLLALSILHYMSLRSNKGLWIKSTAGLETFMEEWNGHNTFVYPLKFDELLQ